MSAVVSDARAARLAEIRDAAQRHRDALMTSGRARVYTSYCVPAVQFCDVLEVDGDTVTIRWDCNGREDVMPRGMLYVERQPAPALRRTEEDAS